MILAIKSMKNDKFSYAINRNPAGIPKMERHRKGLMLGWFHPHDEQMYCVEFQDSPDEVSYEEYKDQKFDYLSRSKYNHPAIAHNIISEFFKVNEEFDMVDKYTLDITDFPGKERDKSLFNRYTPLDIVGDRISFEGTLSDFTKWLKLMFFYLCSKDRTYFIQDDRVKPYVEMLNELDAPYFIRYTFRNWLIRGSKKRWEECKDLINAGKYELGMLDNMSSRKQFARDNIQDSHVIDYGCGEGQYIKMLAGQNESYLGYDVCEDALRRAENKASDLVDYDYAIVDPSALEDVMITYDHKRNVCVLCTEVIEHMEQNELNEFVNFIDKNEPEKVVITTPNSSFNENYLLEDDEMRHDDHKFEFTETEFEDWIIDNFGTKYGGTILPVGDIVDGEPTTFGLVLVLNKDYEESF